MGRAEDLKSQLSQLKCEIDYVTEHMTARKRYPKQTQETIAHL
jgi:hypothetical protein